MTVQKCRKLTHMDADFTYDSKNKIYHNKADLKESQIMQENWNLANRLMNVSSVISKDKQI